MSEREIPSALYEIRDSGIHNRGLFADTEIPENTCIVQYTGKKISKKESDRRGMERMEEARRDGGGFVYIFELNKRYDIDGNVEKNVARLINHSCDPNCEAQVIKGQIWIVAMADIEPGEELTYDYGYDLEHFMEHPCRCGSENCVGYIVRTDKRRKLKRILKQRKKRDRNKKR